MDTQESWPVRKPSKQYGATRLGYYISRNQRSNRPTSYSAGTEVDLGLLIICPSNCLNLADGADLVASLLQYNLKGILKHYNPFFALLFTWGH